jgi:hypothetical protein
LRPTSTDAANSGSNGADGSGLNLRAGGRVGGGCLLVAVAEISRVLRFRIEQARADALGESAGKLLLVHTSVESLTLTAKDRLERISGELLV